MTRSSGSCGAVDELGRVRGALDGGGEVGLRGPAAPPPRSARGTSARCGEVYAAGAQPVALEDRGGHPHGRGLAVGARRRGSTRSAAAACRAPSSACACGRARTACRTARGRAGSSSAWRQVSSPSSSQLPPRSRSSLSRSACDHLGGRLLDELLVGELALGALDLRCELPRRRASLPARRLLGVDGVGGEHLTAPPGTATVAARRRRRRRDELEPRQPGDLLARSRRSPRRRAAPARGGRAVAPDLVAVAAQRRSRPRSARPTSPSASASISVAVGSGQSAPPAADARRAGTTRSPRSRTA